MARLVGSTDDFLQLLAGASVQDPISFYTSSQDSILFPNMPSASISGNSTVFSMTKPNPTSYTVTLQLYGPTLLVLDQAFSQDWTARIGGVIVKDHLLVNHFANGWLLVGNGRTIVSLEFSPQTFVWYGIAISFLSTAVALAIVIRGQRKKNSGGRGLKPDPRT
jgi:hypothetical protein